MKHFPNSGAQFLVGAAIGSGNAALAAERGGADFLLAINAGRLRNMGAPSIACMLPIHDAAPLTQGFALSELLPQCKVPVLLGVNAWGESCDAAEIAEQVKRSGFAGAVNFPSGMHYSHAMQQLLSRAGRGMEKEVELLRAVQDVGLTTMFYCATRTQARLGADAGLDMVCLNLGWNAGGAFGHRMRASIEETASVAREIGRLIKRIHPDVAFLLEGGPIVTAEDLGRVTARAPIDGYVGGSTIERLPFEASVADQIDAYRRASKRRVALDAESAKLVSWGQRCGFIGRSSVLVGFLRRLRALASLHTPVMVIAEPGVDVGPTIAALASQSARGKKTVLEIDLLSEDFPAGVGRKLFGSAEQGGLNSGALADDGLGMIIVHAPSALPATVQRRLARALREGNFVVTGSRRRRQILPRVVLVADDWDRGGAEQNSSSLELSRVMAGWTLRLPPLRERIEDLPALLVTNAAALNPNADGRSVFSAAAKKLLSTHTWPRNEAELRALLGNLAGRKLPGPIQPEDIAELLKSPDPGESDARTEKNRVVEALWRNGFHRTRTAEALGISRKTLYNKMAKYGLKG
ncbi:phosphoenolpyruvate hydrolase family protein [Pelagibius sp. Alg239-R121]|uniref:phosphoenolpyruvate hydrolase family protein n=1 Tax=Pelagibius sp. Alg239-R121 TaxID=2993448 RepID=UPI0024A6C9D9|nr:phosphoenolpyruvate hydrolase family protein [Pelagibius sp. Alg239-R121]